jgi:pimeloyl-ACP methyl ester carboxylesterase
VPSEHERTTPRGRHVDVPGRGSLYVREAQGPPRAPTLVLLHGLGATASLNWDPVIPTLARRFRVVAPDQRGHGRGLRCGSRFTLEDCADDVAALVEALGVGRVLVAGYSMGGPITQLLARRHPHLVAGMVFVATARDFGGHPIERLRFAVLTPAALASRLSPGLPDVVPESLRHHGLLGTLVDELGGHQTRALVAATAALGRFTSREWIDELTAPAAVVATDGDGIVPVRRQLKLAASLDAPVVHLDGHHLVAHSDPDALAAAMLEAVDLLPRRVRSRRRRRLVAA